MGVMKDEAANENDPLLVYDLAWPAQMVFHLLPRVDIAATCSTGKA